MAQPDAIFQVGIIVVRGRSIGVGHHGDVDCGWLWAAVHMGSRARELARPADLHYARAIDVPSACRGAHSGQLATCNGALSVGQSHAFARNNVSRSCIYTASILHYRSSPAYSRRIIFQASLRPPQRMMCVNLVMYMRDFYLSLALSTSPVNPTPDVQR